MHSVLVVDDEPFVRLSIASLRPWGDDGYDFLAEAGNGAEALAVLAARPEIDIILLDLSMPVMDGLEFLRRLSADPTRPAMAVVVLSAHDDYHLVRQAFNLGARDYLLKGEMDGPSLRTALDKAAVGIAESRERDQAIVQRRHLELLKGQVLRDVLAGAASAALEETLQGLGIVLPPPLHVCCFWIDNLQAVAAREAPDGLERFTEMVSRSLWQVLARWGTGEVISLGPGHTAVLFSKGPAPEGTEGAARSFASDAVEYLGRYLNVKVISAVGPSCAAMAQAAESYRAARAARTVESRIVVLAKRAIRERFSDPQFSLEEASQRAGVSKNHLSYEFSRETGETFTDYLTRTRVEEAKRLLATTPLMVYEVGERVGYPSVEHFSRVFKKLVGVSPVRFKAGYGRDEDEGER
ncbi:MAG TPA: response regulator [Anaeromyxobacter sp.]|nr:response regulator [Anaeromyxobacter sp.]